MSFANMPTGGDEVKENASSKSGKCIECKSDLVSKGAKSIGCDFCHNWYCLKCSKMKTTLFNEIAKAQDSGVLWTCSHCRFALPGVKDLMARLASLESKVVDLQKSGTNSGTNVDKESIREILREEKMEEEEINARKLNVIVYSLGESDSDVVETCKRHDVDKLSHILNDTLNLDVECERIVRLGKRLDKDGRRRTRPLKFAVKDFETKAIPIRFYV